MSGRVVTAQHLTKVYPSGTEALGGLSFEVQEGEIFCLVGPNAAGKTTTLRILATQLTPTAGHVTVFGYDLVRQAQMIREQISVVPQEASPDPDLTPWEHVYYNLRVRGKSRAEAKASAENTLRALDLWEVRQKPAARLSGGLRRRILIAMAIAPRGPLIFLDEPSAGLDPLSRRQLWELLTRLKSDSTILLTTHAMDEAEALSDRILILHQGRLIALGSPGQLRKMLPSSYQTRVLLEGQLNPLSLHHLGRVEPHGEHWVLYPRDKASIREIVQWGIEEKVKITVQPLSLEDVFIYFVRKEDGCGHFNRSGP